MLVAGMKMGQNQAKQAGALKAQGAAEATAAAQAQAAAPAGMDDATIAQLQKMADLNKSGVLSDDEFAAAKKKLLGL
jgi:membrane protease subunit (stomatin/prohibitin family)